MGKILALAAAVLLLGCGPASPPEESGAAAKSATGTPPAEPVIADTPSSRLKAVLDAQPDDVKARYQYRHPQQTLKFFGIEPGMTVIEALPGSGWYSKILVPYLGAEGHLVGANYATSMWPKFGTFDRAFIQSMSTWSTDWPAEARGWEGDNGARIDAFEFGAMPKDMEGQADAALVVRALHNLARFENDGDYLTIALKDLFRALKPGGIVGVVQHAARDEMPDAWANGSNGYLKQKFVVDRMKRAGFEFVASSDINKNAKDQPTTEDRVWRLPPSYQNDTDKAEVRAAMDAIGESNRMTLKFRKPAM